MGKEKPRFKPGDKIYRPGFDNEYIVVGEGDNKYHLVDITMDIEAENVSLNFKTASHFRLLSEKGVKYNKKKLTINGKSTNK